MLKRQLHRQLSEGEVKWLIMCKATQDPLFTSGVPVVERRLIQSHDVQHISAVISSPNLILFSHLEHLDLDTLVIEPTA